MSHIFNFGRIFEDFFDDNDFFDNNDETSNDDMNDDSFDDNNSLTYDDLRIKKYQYEIFIAYNGFRRSKARDGEQRDLKKANRFIALLNNYLDRSTSVIQQHSPVFFTLGWIDNNKERKMHKLDDNILLYASEERMLTFLKTSNVYINFGVTFRDCKRPKDVYRLLRTLYCALIKSANAAFGSSANIYYLYIHKTDNDNIKYTISGNKLSDMFKKRPEELNEFIKISKFFMELDTRIDNDTKRSIVNFYNGSELNDELYEFYRYADIINNKIEKNFNPETRVLTLNINRSAEWHPKKTPDKILKKAKAIGITVKAKCDDGWGSLTIEANGIKDLECWKKILDSHFYRITLYISDTDSSGWKGIDEIDLRDYGFDANRISVYPHNAYYYHPKEIVDKIKYPVFITRENYTEDPNKFVELWKRRNGTL